MSQFNFDDKTVIITAASRGIGFAIAKEFCKTGALVHICSRNEDNLASAAKRLSDYGNVVTHQVNCFDHDSLSRFIDTVGKDTGHIDVLVNNFSGFGLSNDKQGFTQAFSGDMLGVVTASNTAINYMSAGSTIINISSRAADFAHESAPYACIKAAINQYTKSQAKIFADKLVRVNAISPGLIEFPNGYWEQVKNSDLSRYNRLTDITALKRTGTDQEVANVALFLASDLSSYITGQVINVDGGYKI